MELPHPSSVSVLRVLSALCSKTAQSLIHFLTARGSEV